MSFLIACDFEVGGQPFRMADILNRHGVPTWYCSLARDATGHDTTRFHFGERREPWDISDRIRAGGTAPAAIMRRLQAARRDLDIRGALATGAHAFLLGQAGIRYHYWTYGSDLDQQAFGPTWPDGYPVWRRPQARLRFALGVRWRQRRSFLKAAAVLISPYQLPALSRIRPGAPLFFFPHVLRVEEREFLRERAAVDARTLAERINATRYVFSAVRHIWHGAHAAYADNKGNDVALRGFARSLTLAPTPGLKLALVRKGPDVAASERLARALGIAERMAWLDEMPREELFRWFRGADLCLGQFGTPALNFSVLEPLAQGTPCLSYEPPPDPAVPWYPTPRPGSMGRDPEELARTIALLIADEAARSAEAVRSWQWVREQCSEEVFVRAFKVVLGADDPAAVNRQVRGPAFGR